MCWTQIQFDFEEFSLFGNFGSAHRAYVSFLEIDLENGRDRRREHTLKFIEPDITHEGRKMLFRNNVRL